MTAKERVLKVYPDALAFRSMMMEGFFYIACSSEGRISERCRTEEAAWQNAAESLPAAPEHHEFRATVLHPHDLAPWTTCDKCGKVASDSIHAFSARTEQEMTEAELDAELRANGIDPHELSVKMLNRIREEKAAGKSGPLMDEAERQFEEAVNREPVAPVEAKEKEPVCAACDEPIYQREEFGDKAWCHTIGGAIMSNGHVAEPKPTPSFNLREYEVGPSYWTDRVAHFEKVYKCASASFMEAYKAGLLSPNNLDFDEWSSIVEAQTQPDSSSISTKQTFEEWWEERIKEDHYWDFKGIAESAWNAAKGQSE